MPNLAFFSQSNFSDFQNRVQYWRVYACGRCAGLVTARAANWDQEVSEFYPVKNVEISDDIPERPRSFLQQAIESTLSPSGAVMLAASSVDAMLKAKNLRIGSLFERINLAASEHLITTDMAQWAHDVRLDANDQRHADENSPLPTTEDAKRVIEFALALAQIMFVLPARVQRGIRSVKQLQEAP